MSWIKDGETVQGTYCDHVVSGVVESSRVKYGGRVEYTVNLATPITLRWRTEPVTRVLLDETKLIEMESK